MLNALILGIVEGLTEFLPISSTGHLIIAGALLSVHDEKGKVFLITIQTGAMLAVLWEYRKRFARADWRLWENLAVAFLPAAVLGLLFGKVIKAHLFSAVPGAIAFIAGGLVILMVEKGRRLPRVVEVSDMSRTDALKVALAQCFALIPGTSRAGSTIIGGMLFGLSRPAATEFSFFLAVPTLLAAGGYDLLKNRALFSLEDFGLLAVGLLASFLSALLVIRWLIRFVATHDFRVFAWYRIAFGAAVLVSSYTGLIDWTR